MTGDADKNKIPPVVPLRIQTVGEQFKYWIALSHSRRHVLVNEWRFTLPSGVTIVIPEGFETDGASFPWWIPAAMSLLGAITIPLYFSSGATAIILVLWLALVAALQRMILNPIGIALIPGLIHDYLYKNHYLLLENGDKYMEGCTWWKADDLFKRVHIQVNDMWLAGWLTYKFMRLGSWFVWRRYRKS